MARAHRDAELRAGIAAAVRRLVEREGTQEGAAAILGIDQGAVSAAVNMRRTLGLSVLVRLREALGTTLDEILSLPPAGVAPPVDAPIAAVLAFYRGRWGNLQPIMGRLASRTDVPKGGWKKALDHMATFVGDEALSVASATARRRGQRRAG